MQDSSALKQLAGKMARKFVYVVIKKKLLVKWHPNPIYYNALYTIKSELIWSRRIGELDTKSNLLLILKVKL